MMEKIGAPQTHLGLKGMIAEVDEDKDGKISFREFLLIYRFVIYLKHINELFIEWRLGSRVHNKPLRNYTYCLFTIN